jgi:hypothetical protein
MTEQIGFAGPDGVNTISASAKTPLPIGSANPDGSVGDQAYALLGSTATPITVDTVGAWVGPLGRGAYAIRAEGTFGGGTVTLKFRGLDGATAQPFSPAAALTATGSVIVNVGAGGYVQASLSGSTGASIRANIS